MDCEFPPEELGNRMVRLRAAMERQRLEGLVLTGPENIFRATGRQMPRHFAFRAFFVPLDRDPFLIVSAARGDERPGQHPSGRYSHLV